MPSPATIHIPVPQPFIMPPEARQVEREKEIQGSAIATYLANVTRARVNGQESFTPYGDALMLESVGRLANAIKVNVAQAKSSPGVKARCHMYFSHMKAEVVSFVACRTILDCICQRDISATGIALEIARNLEAYTRGYALRDLDQKGFDTLIERANGSARMRQIYIGRFQKHLEVEWERWPKEDRVNIGMTLIHLFVHNVGMVKIEPRRIEKHKTQNFLVATQATVDWIKEKHHRSQLMATMYMPMLCYPRPWKQPRGGGYLTSYIPQLRLVRCRKDHLARLTREAMPQVYRGLNVLQGTPWAINNEVTDVVNHLWKHSIPSAGLPLSEDLELPIRPKEGSPDSVMRDWGEKYGGIKRANEEAHSSRRLFAKVLYIANKYKDEERFYYPHYLDFRGRAYSACHFLNPQGHDVAKGLLRFANGKPLGAKLAITKRHGDGTKEISPLGWLMIHGANSFGIDKVSFQDRIAWVRDNERRILRAAHSPLDHLGDWTKDDNGKEIDDPCQFLAFCFEWAKCIGGRPHEHVSYLPIGLDGTCNGLQHFSAMTRDNIGGANVNLVPGEKPSDIYQVVANEVISIMVATLKVDPNHAYAKKWLDFGITRTGMKKPVMILPYGGTRFTMKDYLVDWYLGVLKKDPNHYDPFHKGDLFWAVVYLRDRVWDAIQKTVVKSVEVMDWLRSMSQILADHNLDTEWRAPSGFLVKQVNLVQKTRTIKTCLGDFVRYETDIQFDTDRVNKKEAMTGVSPNFVHSKDAAHLKLTLNRMADMAITDITTVHDCYGTHACNVGILGTTLRETFVDMYEQNDVLNQFRDLCRLRIPSADFPEAPSRGNLDLKGVLASPYFFA